MGNETDDPGPNRYIIASKYNRLFANRGKTFDANRDGAVGVSGDVPQPAGVRGIGSILCRMGLLLPKSGLCVLVLAGTEGSLG